MMGPCNLLRTQESPYLRREPNFVWKKLTVNKNKTKTKTNKKQTIQLQVLMSVLA